MFKQKKKKGQSTIEYLILVTGVIAALIAFLKPGGPFNVQFNASLQQSTDGMLNMANRLRISRPLAP